MPAVAHHFLEMFAVVIIVLVGVEGVDYDNGSQVLVFNAANTTLTVGIPTSKDLLTNERSETFQVSLTTNSSAGTLILSPQTANVTICKGLATLSVIM